MGPFRANGPSAGPAEASGFPEAHGPPKVHGPRGHCTPLPPPPSRWPWTRAKLGKQSSEMKRYQYPLLSS